MICLLSLLVFSILGIFSASHRKLAKEAFNCVRNKARRKPCETDLEDDVKASVVGKVLKYSPRAARILNKYFDVFSWLLVIGLLVTGLYSSYSIYNLFVYGNCNGATATANCSINSGANIISKLVGLVTG
ncbi:MAG: hypothetical protein SV186_01870 [Candidatus Nanohaloarchaea archaeon]|nr:hypothetical protein [Candidatus Nanohaloarchaea archaeon]